MFRHFVLVTAIASLVAGCQCKGTIIVSGDGGPGGGGNGGGGGGGGAGGAGGGGGDFDAGDGTLTGGVPPGGFTLDGGSGGQGDGVKLDPNGWVVLNSGSIEFHFMWIANSAAGTVSKYDTRNGKEVGRYYSVIPKNCANSAGPPCAGGNIISMRGNMANSPSRTAIDLYGDVWVANRAVGLQGTVTKIANDPSSCIDRNNDGVIRTSKDIDGDGSIATGAAAGEMIIPSNWGDPLEYDECVLFSTEVGGPGGDVAVRAVTISQGLEGTAGDIWAGVYREHKFYKLNPANGQVVPVNGTGATSIDIGWGMYGAAVDSKQRLWAVYPGAAWLALVDTQAGTLVASNLKPPGGTACGSYAIGIDGKDRVWLPGWTAGSVACRYDHGTGVTATPGTWTSFSFAATPCQNGVNFGRPRGIAADDQGSVFMSADSPGAQLIKFNAETGAVVPFNTGSGPQSCIDATDSATSSSIGVGLDGDGQPWTNNYSGNAMRIDKNTGAITRTTQQGAGLYTYSDFTGYQLRKFTSPRGTYRKDMRGCSADTTWKSVVWDASVPPNTSVKLYVKVASTADGLNSSTATRYGPFTTSPADLAAAGVPKAEYMRLEFQLSSANGTSSPALKSFSVVWSCEGTIG
ncbi:MAG: Vgb family protein [Myxococcaceae bacterium]